MSRSFWGLKHDIIYIHTGTRNITAFPTVKDRTEEIDHLLEQEYGRFEVMWEKIAETYHCHVIQNNFELPFYWHMYKYVMSVPASIELTVNIIKSIYGKKGKAPVLDLDNIIWSGPVVYHAVRETGRPVRGQRGGIRS